MSKNKLSLLQKPIMASDKVTQFAGRGRKSSAASAPKGAKSGLVPVNDARLTSNIREDVHMKLKMRAVQERTTIGELIEQWVDGWK